MLHENIRTGLGSPHKSTDVQLRSHPDDDCTFASGFGIGTTSARRVSSNSRTRRITATSTSSGSRRRKGHYGGIQFLCEVKLRRSLSIRRSVERRTFQEYLSPIPELAGGGRGGRNSAPPPP